MGQGDNTRSVEFSADGRLILSAPWGRNVRLWDASSGHVLAPAIIPNDDIILDAAFDPNGDRLAHAIRNLVCLRPIYA